MNYLFDPLTVEYRSYTIVREPPQWLVRIKAKSGETVPNDLDQRYTEVRIAKEFIDKYESKLTH